ncbi:uncharacterized protein EV422DRAFT_619963 [Fimicolochytrium jonesii]|uniref:uncharacterized protein n=1 Tax=Fimicolochytrium jonesii TaxID=1396493 RepID=UPI0022FEE914|nr:uncharacterized protein EV422DRAFT_619963 [Fimicolochytrium jonesii]KAI8821065.1 hypothetical protein EV422DRAFT_619963 [Fimicolochytrium jonesii]
MSNPRVSALASEERPYDDSKSPTRSKLVRYAESATWIVIALASGYFANLADALQNYGYGLPFYLLFTSLAGFIIIFIYLQFYVPMKTGSRVDLSKWETQARLPVQIATAFGTLSMLSSCWMLWPAYGFLSPPLVFVLFMGGLSFIGLF